MSPIGRGRGGVGGRGGGTPQRARNIFFDPVVIFVMPEPSWYRTSIYLTSSQSLGYSPIEPRV